VEESKEQRQGGPKLLSASIRAYTGAVGVTTNRKVAGPQPPPKIAEPQPPHKIDEPKPSKHYGCTTSCDFGNFLIIAIDGYPLIKNRLLTANRFSLIVDFLCSFEIHTKSRVQYMSD
jgi:hypothetical protein